MRSRTILVALAAASVLLVLTACVPQRPTPTPPTRAEIIANNQQLLDSTRTLEGLVALPPLTTSTDLPKSEAEWSAALFACLARAGYPDLVVGGAGSGYSVGQTDVSTQATVDQKVALYSCIAAHPENPVAEGKLFSTSQLQYLWGYFTTWQIPCLRLNGYTIDAVPSRAEFFSDSGRLWAPYDVVDIPRGEVTLTDGVDRQLHQFEIVCGPKFGVITSAD